MTEIAVVDHGAGNLVSIAQGLEHAGASVSVAVGPDDLLGVDGVVLPGVGSVAAAWDRLVEQRLVDPLRELTVPLLGVCVGLQLLFEGSDEDDGGGLGLIEGRVRRLEDTPRLPHIGWNDLDIVSTEPILAGVGSRDTFYFVHSYVPFPADAEATVATTSYGRPFTAVARHGDVIGVQFHPERSGPKGLRIIANFVASCRGRANAA